MPVYEYEPDDRDCLICEGRFEALQAVTEDALKLCPWCGMEVRRVISRASIRIAGAQNEDKASRKGFTTFRRAETGVWEKVAGEGPDMLVGSKDDVASVEAEKKSPKIIDLDKNSD